MWWAYRIGGPPLYVVVVRRRRPHSLSMFPSETTGPIKVKFHMELRSVRVAERLALPTSDHGVAGSNPAGGEILPEPKRRFIAQSLSCSSSHRLEMTEILLKGRKTLIHPSIHMELLWDGETKVCSNGPGHMTKMATMPIYSKNLKNSPWNQKGWWHFYDRVRFVPDASVWVTAFRALSALVFPSLF